MLPYSRQTVNEEDIRAVCDVLRSPWLTTGPAVERFESALCEYTGARYAVAVSSGTAALTLVYRACGGSRYIVSPLSFLATATAATALKKYVSFRDVDRHTGNMIDPCVHWQDWVAPVHFAGRAADLSHVNSNKGRIIEDACHALGAMDFDGCSRVGSCRHSLATCMSFHPVKPITTGEGGAVTTNDEGLAQEIRRLRNHGRDERGLMVSLGGNFRMTDIAAALGTSQLKRCDAMRWQRVLLATRYEDALIDRVITSYGVSIPQFGHPGESNSWHLYPIRINAGRAKRDAVKRRLNERGIGAQVHYDPIIPLHPYYRERYYHKEGMWPNAEAWAATELSLPLWSGMVEADVLHVVEELRAALEDKSEVPLLLATRYEDALFGW
jgi:dTDP-4-amino-4,6-dideoxygalactose transaminase